MSKWGDCNDCCLWLCYNDAMQCDMSLDDFLHFTTLTCVLRSRDPRSLTRGNRVCWKAWTCMIMGTNRLHIPWWYPITYAWFVYSGCLKPIEKTRTARTGIVYLIHVMVRLHSRLSTVFQSNSLKLDYCNQMIDQRPESRENWGQYITNIHQEEIWTKPLNPRAYSMWYIRYLLCQVR